MHGCISALHGLHLCTSRCCLCVRHVCGIILLHVCVPMQVFIVHINRTAWQMHGKKEKLKHKVSVSDDARVLHSNAIPLRHIRT